MSPAEGTSGRLRHVSRKVFAATLVVCTSIVLVFLGALDWVGRAEQFARAGDGLKAMVAFVQSQPVVFATIALFLLGLFLATDVRLPPLWRLIQGRIRLQFAQGEPWVRQHESSNIPLPSGNSVHPPVRFFRVELLPPYHGAARLCRAFLRNVEEWKDGAFAQTAYDGTQPLRWANESNLSVIFEPRDVSNVHRQFIDLLSVDPFFNAVKVKWPTPEWTAYQSLFASPGVFRLTISATSDGNGDAELQLILVWSGEWDRTEVMTESEWLKACRVSPSAHDVHASAKRRAPAPWREPALGQ